MSEPVRRIPRLGWAIAFLVATTLMAMAWVNIKDTRPAVVDLPVYAKVPEFSFTDQQGKRVTNADLDGQVWVASFIFTRCPNPCPLISDRMMELQSAIQKKGGNVKLISVSVDPEHDTPPVLAEYASRYSADPAIWRFLTGDPAEIEKFVTKGMLQPLVTEPGETPSHSQRFVVVDADGDMRSYHNLSDPELMPKVLMDIGKLLRENTSRPKETAAPLK